MTANQQVSTVTRVEQGLAQMSKQFQSMLPAHIEPRKFLRAAVTAVQNTPDLQQANYESIIAACQKAATDGLILDGREAALVVFNVKDGNTWIKKAQYMPMVAGILKKARQSGQISTLYTHAVYSNEHFEYYVDENGEHIKHVPTVMGDRGDFLLAYSGAKMKDGSTQVAVMTLDDIERIRKVSKSGSDDKGEAKGIWKTWYPEMACKTALRKLCKFLPSSTDLDQVLAHDLETYNNVDGDEQQPASAAAEPKKQTANDKLKAKAAAKAQGQTIEGTATRVDDPDTGPTPPPMTDDDMPI